ncbi:MAG: cobalamin-dependent protein [Myxococcaceae bacterium]|nr:cobalamin-dependent protein [Myxococcaceae bacterium]
MPPRPLSPVLLLGAGRGEATCGILYLAAYLRRNGVEAFVRLVDDDTDDETIAQSMTALLSHVKPQLIGISLKWFNHLSRGLLIAQTVRHIDPDVRIVVGGNSASYFWRELAAYDCIDDIVLGDGERPLLSVCRRDKAPFNCVTRAQDGHPKRAPLGYVQSVKSDEVFYSHFDDMFLSGIDRHSFSGWVQPGKGCSENCVYCGGTRGMEQASFGRPTSFLRPVKSVQKDHHEIVGRGWQLRYDFAGGTADFLTHAWQGHDLSRHAVTYFLWGVPERSLVDALSATFGRVYMVLDVGCFSQTQRHDLMRRGLLKPCPTDAELFDTVDFCRQHPNVKLEVCGIAGLPHTSDEALREELPLVEKLLERGLDVGCQRLESQPGALVTQHADRFGMATDAHTFEGFVDWFSAHGHATDGAFPMVRYRDVKLEAKVQKHFEKVYRAMQRGKPTRHASLHTRWVSNVGAQADVSLGEWLGTFRVPPALAQRRLRVIRSVDGAGVACAPDLNERVFADPNVQTGAVATAILAALELFRTPANTDEAMAQLRRSQKLPPGLVQDVIAQLADGGFLRVAK